jgi:two-component system nitrogen regulation sensor histidine kinase NtrY
MPSSARFSLAGRLALVIGLDLVVAAAIAGAAAQLGLPGWAVALAALTAAAPFAAWSLARFWAPVEATLRAVSDGVRGFHENDFSLRLVVARSDELGELVKLYNRLGDALRLERSDIYQRELLLDTLLQGAPMAIVLSNELDRVVFANAAARQLLAGGQRLHGRELGKAVASAPEELRRAIASGEDMLLSVAGEAASGGEETWRVVHRRFFLNTREQRLLVVERITPELKRQEVEIWKKVIRLMSHELNNSLAPVSSLVHSARLVAGRPDRVHRLEEIHEAIAERVEHLCRFLEGYARFARLPKPRREEVPWRDFLEAVRRFFPFRTGEIPDARGFFDAAQMQQVLINLVKNAAEAQGPAEEIEVALEAAGDGGWLLSVLDRGPGMDEETMRAALVPFYSSKPSGTGLGLPLCAEILTAHGGALLLRSRPGGGTVVTCRLPAPRLEGGPLSLRP